MVVREMAGVAAADLVDGEDPEAVGAVRVEGELQVVELPRHPLPLLPPPPAVLRVLLLTSLHDELWETGRERSLQNVLWCNV